MFFIMTLPTILKGQLTSKDIAVHAAIWLVVGLAFGFSMKLFINSKK